MTLRRLRADDLARLQAYRSDPEVGRYQGWEPMTDAEARAMIAEMAAAPCPTLGDWVQIAGLASDTSVRRLVGIADVRNAPSARLLERLGMTLEAEQETTFRGEPCREWRYAMRVERQRGP